MREIISTPKLRNWPSGTQWPTGAHLQEPVDALRILGGGGQYDLVRPADLILYARFLGKITDQDANGNKFPGIAPGGKGQTVQDERYFVNRCYINDSLPNERIDLQTDVLDPVGIYVVTNLAEQFCHSHCLAKDTFVEVNGWLDHASPQQVRYEMNVVPMWRVRPTGTSFTQLTGGSAITLGKGRYVGVIMNAPTTDATLTNTVTLADFGTDGPTCLIYSHFEMDLSLSAAVIDWTTGGTFRPKMWQAMPLKPYADGTPVFAIDGRQGEPC